ncbi:class I SAM-dependent DNA methyltransferase [Pseudonocardia sp. EC080610-09]|uniref:HsdM family class I SAM-dependent methyltransferase n=1 Tax=Pseudonocardia sp. EC080610-09 TaxID=1688404 RepID=UPI0009EB7479|nr:N-6 DNA methylase [Pseudonocardia sp. EC080610-09]
MHLAKDIVRSDTAELRKARGAFFTPYSIAKFLADWTIRDPRAGRVLDPTCGDGVFLLAAAERLKDLGCTPSEIHDQIFGVDLHAASLDQSQANLEAGGFSGTLLPPGDFFQQALPSQIGSQLPEFDTILGNPPFVRYQTHRGDARKRSASAALAQGVRLSGLASSWAALLVHASGFLKPDGRIAMVLPAELMTVGYAEPIRRWLRARFAKVHLVLFERLQFADAEEQVVLLVASGRGGCKTFNLHHVNTADDLNKVHIFDTDSVIPVASGKWTDLLLPQANRDAYSALTAASFTSLSSFGQTELGTVTGANKFFTLTESTRQEYGLKPGTQVQKVVPPGSRHLRGLGFSEGDWQQLRLEGARVWLLNPEDTQPRGGLKKYISEGVEQGLNETYKCSIRTPWWRPPRPWAPDLFFTYMSHIAPRLISNHVEASFVNSMHGVRLTESFPKEAVPALPLLSLNSVTALGAELQGRSYGGGIVKMEPREASALPMPLVPHILAAWERLRHKQLTLEHSYRASSLASVVEQVDEVLLSEVLEISKEDVGLIRGALAKLRSRRIRGSSERVQK